MEPNLDSNSAVCFAVINTLVTLASRGQKDTLKQLGVPDKDIERLARFSIKDIDTLTSSSCHRVDLRGGVRTMLKKPVPEKYREYIEFGACNEMLGHHFRISAAQGSEWRDDEGVREGYRARKFSHTEHKAALNALQKLALEYLTFKDVAPEQLLKLAKEHELSVRSLWNQLKEWENEK